MLETIAEKIVADLKKEDIIEGEDEEIYAFGSNQSIFLILNLITPIFLAIFFNKKLEITVFLIEFILLRSYAGGYHAKSQFKCLILSSIMQIIAIFLISIISIDKVILIISIIIFSFIIGHLSPIESDNKPLDEIERKTYKKKAIIILLMINLLTLVDVYLNSNIVCNISFIVIGFVLILQIISKLLRD